MDYLGERSRSSNVSKIPDMAPKFIQISDAPLAQVFVRVKLHVILSLYELAELIQASCGRVFLLPKGLG